MTIDPELITLILQALQTPHIAVLFGMLATHYIWISNK